MKEKIALLVGGDSKEAEISRKTGAAFASALKSLSLDYEVIECDSSFPKKLLEGKYSKALLALHGKTGEDGKVQGFLETIKLPYTGSGVLSSALCFEKHITKDYLERFEVLSPSHQLVTKPSEAKSVSSRWAEYPCIVKPSNEGSSVGVFICKDESELLKSITKSFTFTKSVMVEQFIDGLELTVPVLNGKALTSIMITPKDGFYNYENKYTVGNSEYKLAPELPESSLKKMNQVSELIYDKCLINTYCRVDFMIDHKSNEPYFLEVNTLPGFVDTSLFPKAAAYDGIPFPELIQILLAGASLDGQVIKG